MISYEHKHASKVTEKECKFIHKLRIEDVGLIWEDFKQKRKYRKCFVVLAKNSKDIPIAWGLLFYEQYGREWTFSVFVKKSYRRKGIGTHIYKMMRRKHHLANENINVYRHDDKSIFFFDKLQK